MSAASSESPAPHLRADLALIAITALWGATFVVVKDALDHSDPFSFLAIRFGIGGAAALAFSWRAFSGEARPRLLRTGTLLGTFLFLGYAFQTVGLQYTTGSRSAFITGLAVVLVPVVSILVLRRRPSLPSLVGVAIAFAGLLVLTGGLSEPAEDPQVYWGDLLTLGCAVMFSFHIALTGRFSRGQHPLALVTVQLFVVALLSLASLPFVDARVEWTWDFLAAAVLTGVFASTVAISVQTWAQARTSAVRAALVFSLEPVFAASLAVALGRDRLGQREVLGGLLTILAVVVAEAGGAWWARRRLPA